MQNPTNLRTTISKLPYKIKERLCAEAFKLKERKGRRARFADLVALIDRQAKIAMDPLVIFQPSWKDYSKGKAARKEGGSWKQFCNQCC